MSSNRCYDCGYLKSDCICVFTLHFVDGETMSYNRRGVLVGVTDNEGRIEDHEGYALGNGCPDISGIWYDDEHCTIPWDEVVSYKYTDFHLLSGMYIDNGQVTEEGLITKIELNGDVKWDTSEPETIDAGTVLVECPKCHTDYRITVDLDNYRPVWCTYCGAHGLKILRQL